MRKNSKKFFAAIAATALCSLSMTGMISANAAELSSSANLYRVPAQMAKEPEVNTFIANEEIKLTPVKSSEGMISSGEIMSHSGVGMVSSGVGMVSSGVGMVSSGVGMVSSGVGMVSPGERMSHSGVGMVSSGRVIMQRRIKKIIISKDGKLYIVYEITFIDPITGKRIVITETVGVNDDEPPINPRATNYNKIVKEKFGFEMSELIDDTDYDMIKAECAKYDLNPEIYNIIDNSAVAKANTGKINVKLSK